MESHSEPNFAQPYTFTSRELDAESGLHYFRNRYYHSITGRFVGEDPKGFGAGVNFYGYVDGNPVTRVDPYGLDWLTDISNFSAGVGDYLSGGFMNSFGFAERVLGNRAVSLSQFARQLSPLADVVDWCTTAYKSGEYTGALIGTSLLWSTGLNAAANTVIYSPLNLGIRAAKEGTTIGKTPIGKLLNYIDRNIFEIPRPIWYAASGTYVANASGTVTAVIESVGKIVQFEMKILNWLNIPISFK
jgi:RHS repeat-associated protein